jgi:hypothetical protein
MLSHLKWSLPVALLIAVVAAAVALGAAALPGFSRHTAIDIALNSTETFDSTDAPGTISRTDPQTGSPCSVTTSSHVVWFTWKATVSDTITATTVGSDYDTVLYVFRAGKLIGCNDDDPTLGSGCPAGGDEHCSAVTFTSVEGRRYFFAVGGFSSASGDAHLNLFD